MSNALNRALALADDIEKFACRVSPAINTHQVVQYNYANPLRNLAVQFVGNINRIGDADLIGLTAKIDPNVSMVEDTHALLPHLQVIIEALRDKSQSLHCTPTVGAYGDFLDKNIIAELRKCNNPNFDVTRLAKMCDELNDAYSRGNFISASLLIRTIINHIPPVFGAQQFSIALENIPASKRKLLSRLQEKRAIADNHAHKLIGKKTTLPSKNQLTPYQTAFEVLIQEIIEKITV